MPAASRIALSLCRSSTYAASCCGLERAGRGRGAVRHRRFDRGGDDPQYLAVGAPGLAAPRHGDHQAGLERRPALRPSARLRAAGGGPFPLLPVLRQHGLRGRGGLHRLAALTRRRPRSNALAGAGPPHSGTHAGCGVA